MTQNHFELVYQVIKYAIKNKRPKCRSAFTYCEDELPSRIDFGKKKYGGPFTTEQVEDVKTFFRLLSVVFFGCATPSVVIVANQLSNRINNLIHGKCLAHIVKHVYAPLPTYTIITVSIPMGQKSPQVLTRCAASNGKSYINRGFYTKGTIHLHGLYWL